MIDGTSTGQLKRDSWLAGAPVTRGIYRESRKRVCGVRSSKEAKQGYGLARVREVEGQEGVTSHTRRVKDGFEIRLVVCIEDQCFEYMNERERLKTGNEYEWSGRGEKWMETLGERREWEGYGMGLYSFCSFPVGRGVRRDGELARLQGSRRVRIGRKRSSDDGDLLRVSCWRKGHRRRDLGV